MEILCLVNHHQNTNLMKSTNLLKTSLAICLGLSIGSCDRSGKFESESSLAPPVVMKFSESEVQTEMTTSEKLIKKAYLDISVEDIEKSKKEIAKLCHDEHAYVFSDHQENYTERMGTEQVIRVPSASFDKLLSGIEGIASKIEGRRIEVSDVTEEFVDTEARIKSKKELESRYYDILKKAAKVEDMLAIESELNKVRSEIERMQGRINLLKSQVAYSTITVNCYQPVVSDFGFASKFVSSLVRGWDSLLEFIIGLISVWPMLIFISAGVYLASRKLKVMKKSNTPA